RSATGRIPGEVDIPDLGQDALHPCEDLCFVCGVIADCRETGPVARRLIGRAPGEEHAREIGDAQKKRQKQDEHQCKLDHGASCLPGVHSGLRMEALMSPKVMSPLPSAPSD